MIKSFKPKQHKIRSQLTSESVSQKKPFQPINKSTNSVKLIPLGGVGDVTKNMYVYEYKDDIVIVDCGVGFPNEEMLGVDLVIPDASYLKDKKYKIRGILISHAHDDHIGGLPYIWPELQVPIYTQKLTAALIKAKFIEHKLPKDQIKTLGINDTVSLGAFKASFYQVSHSIPDSTGIVLNTPVGTIIHQADFKMDWTPVNGQVTEVAKVARVGEQGVVFMTIDCLRVEKQGYTLSEKTIEPTFEKVERETEGKVLITMTSSNITRIQQAINVAVKSGRKLILSGRSVENNFQVARDLGYLDVPAGLVIAQEEVKRFPENKIMIIIAGSQGQPGSSLSRAANNDHKHIQLKPQDAIVFSADPIPSTETAQNALIDLLTNLGCDVYYSAMLSDLHVSVLPNTEVLIKDKNNQVKLEEIQKIDEEVEAYSFNRDNCTSSWKKAKKIIHPYKGKVFKITTKSGRSVEVTAGHSLFALKNCQLIEVKSEDLKLGDCLAISKSLPSLESEEVINFSNFVPKQKGYNQKDGFIFYNGNCIGPTELRLDNTFGRLLGYYLAEGSSPRHLSIVLNAKETELSVEIKDAVKKLFGCYLQIKIKRNAQEITFGTPFLGKIFKGWFGLNAREKRIPGFIFKASEQTKLNFIGAFINGDGGIDKGSKHSRIRVKTASKKLASGLLYLLSSVGIVARFDHIQKNVARFVGKYQFKPTYSYVIRIQGIDYIKKLLPFLSSKFQEYFSDLYTNNKKAASFQTHAPEALPIREINLLEEVSPKSNTVLAALYYQLKNQKQFLNQNFINPKIIERDAEIIGNPLIYYMYGDILFDPIKSIEESEYEGSVYDLSVPGPENFLGGFGGIFLHNSGHAASEELKVMLNLAKPKYILPIGGTFRHMKAFSKMAYDMGYQKDQVLLTKNGQVIEITKDKSFVSGTVPVSNVYIDGIGVGDIGSVVLRDRQKMSEEGVVVVVVAIDQQTGKVVGEPDIISRGFSFGEAAEDLADAGKEIVKSFLNGHQNGPIDWRYLRHEIEENLDKFFFEETKRNPLILTLVMEV